MKKLLLIFLVSFLYSPAFSMSFPGGGKESPIPSVSSSKTPLVKSAVQQICDGNFAGGGRLAQKADGNDPASAKILAVVSQHNDFQKSIQQSRQEAFEKQLDELKKFKDAPENNEPNLLEVFPVILKAHNFAAPDRKMSVLETPYVKETIAKAKKTAEEYEAKGDFINSLFYCYSWLDVLYEDEKTYKDKKEQLEDLAIVKASLQDSPCESTTNRYEKITPEMFTRSLDMLEYGYIEPFRYSDMAEKVFRTCNYLSQVLSVSDNTDKNFNIKFEKDKLQHFTAGINSLQKEFNSSASEVMSKDQYVKFFKNVLALNAETINLPKQIMIWHFADASLNALDPHTTIIWPKQVEDFEKNMTNEFTGIGVEISKEDGQLKAVSLVPGAPAYYSGIDAGDIIETVNGESTKDMSITCAVSKITGPAGTKVKLTIRRTGEEKPREFDITRAKIVVPTTRGWSRDNQGNWLYFVDDKDKIGYVRVTQFSASTASDLDAILTQLESQGMKALILDLRFNTGGYLQSAADIIDLFVEKGVMVSTQPRVGLPTWETAERKGTHPNYPITILINSSSASASEIVAGALSDKAFSRATLVGEQSYGKGSVQTISDYPSNGAQLKYTMAYYHLPSGQRVNDRWAQQKLGKKDWGIMPSVKVEMTNDEIKKLLDIERDNDVLAGLDHDQNKTKLKRHELQETLKADYQLETAILVNKAKLVESGLEQ